MDIKDNFSIFNLFLDKHVKIYTSEGNFRIRVLTIREFCLDETYNAMYHMWTLPSSKLEKTLPIKTETSLKLVHNLLFQLGMYKEYSGIVEKTREALEFFIPNIEIDYADKQLIVDDIIITEEI